MRYEIRPLSVGEILNTGFRLMRNHWRILLVITGCLWTPFAIVEAGFGQMRESHPQGGASVTVLIAHILLPAIAYAPYAAAVTIVLTDCYLGRPASIRRALREMWSVLPQSIWIETLSTVLIVFGMVLLIVPGVWLLLAYLVALQVVVVERVFGRAALRRSRELMAGQRWRGGAIFAASIGLALVVQFGATWALRDSPVAHMLAVRGTGIFFLTFSNAVLVVFYFDVRCRREGFDLEHLATLVEQRDSTPAAPAAR